MLEDYFSLRINSEGLLESLPLLLPGYTPNLDKLPGFLMRLGPQVSARIECDEEGQIEIIQCSMVFSSSKG